jgi:sulfite exporter TauE/SafE
MTALVVAIFVASLMGSLHCVGMCGAFLAIATGDGVSLWKSQAAYHLGRLVTYLTMGVAAGIVGSTLDLGASLAGLQPLAATLAGATMLAIGTLVLLGKLGIRVPQPTPPAFMQKLVQSRLGGVLNWAPTARATAIGMLTTLLPCGWLYAFVITAAGTASVWKAPLVMAVFWLGTLPALIAVGTGVRAAMGAIGRHAAIIACVLVMIAGGWTIWNRSHLDPANWIVKGALESDQPATPTCCPTTP